MAKWYGKVGYAESVESTPGVWTDRVVTRHYYGDIVKGSSGWTPNTDSVNDDLTVNCQISIVADPFAFKKFHAMKWVELYGTKWKVKGVDPKPPRLILTLGGVYNGE